MKENLYRVVSFDRGSVAAPNTGERVSYLETPSRAAAMREFAHRAKITDALEQHREISIYAGEHSKRIYQLLISPISRWLRIHPSGINRIGAGQ